MTIYVRIDEGLGNQLFQYAFGRALEAEGKMVKYDINAYHFRSIHQGFELSRIFGLTLNLASFAEIKKLFGDFYSLAGRVKHKIFGYRNRRNIVREASYHTFNYHPEYLHPEEGSYMRGYWQAWQYPNKIKSLLKSQLQFPPSNNSQFHKVCEEIQTTNSVGIHIRRGDYLKSPHHQVLPLNYYESAIHIIEQHIMEPKYFIFSNDPEWAKENLNLSHMQIVDMNKGAESYRDMQLMSMCKALIIANSSFSWWGAWLNQNIHPLIIAPKLWFSRDHTIKDIWLPSWTVI